jgi:hypothetical protein
VPFVFEAESYVLDQAHLQPGNARVFDKIRAPYHPILLPTVVQLDDAEYFVRLLSLSEFVFLEANFACLLWLL